MTMLKPTSKPLYQQVKQHLVHRVITGEWKPGHLLPSETKLAEEYGLSQGTVRKAIEEMASEGLVSRQAGKGTFVTSHEGDYHPFRFHKFFSDDNQRIAKDEAVFISSRAATAHDRVAKALKLQPGSQGCETIRLRNSNQRPVLIETIFLPENICPDAKNLLQHDKPKSIYLFLERHYNLLITRVVEQVRARAATEQEAKLLFLNINEPVLEVERVAFSLGGEPIEWRTMVGPTDSIHYRNDLD